MAKTLEERLEAAQTAHERAQRRVMEAQTVAATRRARVKEIERAITARAGKRRPRAEDGRLEPHVQAGRANVARLRTVFRQARRPITQAHAGKCAGMNSGTMTYAVRALLADGLIEPTGAMMGKSPEYRFVSRARRVTRLEPGQ